MQNRFSKKEWSKIILTLETAVSEGCAGFLPELLSVNSMSPQAVNVFGRSIKSPETGDPLAYISGISATGLRASAFVEAEQILDHYSALLSSVKRLLSFVTYLSLPSGHQPYHTIVDAGLFQWMAKDAQEAVYLGLISHKIAEISLIPGIVGLDGLADSAELEKATVLPERELILKYLGDVDEQIKSPTPSQKNIFGETRRRIPNWFSFDTPTYNTLQKNSPAEALEMAARLPFIYTHLDEIIQQVLHEFAEVSGKKIELLESYKTEDAEHLLIVEGAAFETCKKAVDKLRQQKEKVGCLRVVMLQPFPGADLVKLLSGKKAVTVLDQTYLSASAEGPLFREVAAALNKALDNSSAMQINPDYPILGKNQKPLVYRGLCGLGGKVITVSEAVSVFENSLSLNSTNKGLFTGTQKNNSDLRHKFMSGVSFTKTNPDLPKVEAELDRLQTDYPELYKLTLPETSSSEAPTGKASAEQTLNISTELPLAIRSYHDQGPPYTRLSRFQNQTGIFYQENKEQKLNVTPFDALPVVPAATAELREMTQLRTNVPQFLASECTGCGDCFVQCPESALAPVVSPTEALLQAAAAQAKKNAEPITQLTPLIKPIAQAAAKILREATGTVQSAADFFPQAFSKTIEQKKVAGELLDLLTEEFERLMKSLQEFPLARTETFFAKAEAAKRGAGELFSLAIDPYSCSGCGFCVEKCQQKALLMETQTPEIVEKLRHNFKYWEYLADTSIETMRRVLADAEYSSLAAVLLSRNYYKSLGHSSVNNKELLFTENENAQSSKFQQQYYGEKNILHLISAVSESVTQPAVSTLAKEIKEMHAKLVLRIQAKMGEALPHDNFKTLAQTLAVDTKTRVHFDKLLHLINEKENTAPVDITALRRMVDLEQSISAMHWALTVGPTGVGRARMGMSLLGSDSLVWGQKYPEHPFFYPVWAQGGQGKAEITLGLLEGHLRHFLDNIRLLRRAKLEADGKYKPHLHDAQISSLTWEDLNDTERAACPNIFLVGDHRSLNERSLSAWSVLLNSNMPVRIVVLDSTDTVTPHLHASALAKVALLSMTYRNAFVMQSSLTTPQHFHDGLVSGFKVSGPALFHLHVPDSAAADELLLQSRTFPAITFDASAKGVFGNLIDLSANPPAAESTLTFADWAFTQECFKHHFAVLDDDISAAVPLSKWLGEEAENNDAVPYIEQILADGVTRKISVSADVSKASILIRDQWRLLQEISGELTPFTEKVKKQLEEKSASEHQVELENLKEEYEQKLQELENDFQGRTKEIIRERLLALAGYPINQH